MFPEKTLLAQLFDTRRYSLREKKKTNIETQDASKDRKSHREAHPKNIILFYINNIRHENET